MERTPTFWLTDSTGRPVRIAANSLSQAINTLNEHHAAEAKAWPAALEAFEEAWASLEQPPPSTSALRRHVEDLTTQAGQLRQQRDEILAILLQMRSPLADVLLEEHTMRSEKAIFTGFVEAQLQEDAPRPLGGLDLGVPDRLRILAATVAWARSCSYQAATGALGPAYLLEQTVVAPTPEGTAFHEQVAVVRARLQEFLVASWSGRGG